MIIKHFFSRFGLVLVFVLAIHAVYTLLALRPSAHDNQNNALQYQPAEPAVVLTENFDASRFAGVFNIKPLDETSTNGSDNTEQTTAAPINLKVLAITLDNNVYQALIALEQKDNSRVQQVRVGDQLADYQVETISMHQVVLSTADDERVLKLFKVEQVSPAPAPNKDN